MRDPDSFQKKSKNFLSSLPGTIKAVAALITATGGFILIMSKTGCINRKAAVNTSVVSNTVQNDTTHPGNISYSPAEIKYILRNITYTINEANFELLPDKEITLMLKIKCTNNSGYDYNFYAKYIRARIGNDSYPPDPYSPSEGYQAVLSNGFKEMQYNYKLPAGVNNFSLVFYDDTTEIGSSSFVLK